MRLVTLNFRSGLSLPLQSNLHPAIELFRSLSPDFICLQEVDRRLPRSHWRDQSRTLAEALGMKFHFFPAISCFGSGFGLSILSLYPIKSSQRIYLPFRGEPRPLAEAIFDAPFPFRLLNVHLGLNESEREKQIASLVRHLSQSSLPTLLCGDFNEVSSTTTMKSLMEMTSLREIRDDYYLPTFPVLSPHVRLDMIFTTPEIEQIDAFVCPTVISDHLAFAADFKIKNARNVSCETFRA